MDPSLTGRETVGPGLGSVLMDQRMRADKHRMNFEALRSQYIVLQEAHAKLQVDNEVLGEELKQLQSRSEDIIATLQKERDRAIAECEEQRSQVPSEEVRERMRSQLLSEVEAPFRRYIQELEKELDEFKSDYNKLRYNYSFLKSEFESSQSQHATVLEEQAARHKAELSKLLAEKRDLVARTQRDLPAEMKKLRQLQRENAELQQKVGLLTSELQESRDKMSELNTEQQQSLKDLQRQLAEADARAGLSEREREAADGRSQRLEQECLSVKEELQRVTREVEQGEEAVAARDRKLDSLAHTHRVELSELKISHAQQCSQLVREKEQCGREVEELRAKMEVLQRTVEQQQTRLAAKDREVESRVAEAHEEEWSRTASVQQEKAELEERVTQLERERGEKMAALRAELQSCEERLRGVSSEKLAAASELSSVKKQCGVQREKMSELEQEVLTLRAAQREGSKMAARVASLEQAELDLAGEKERLQVCLGACQQEVGACRQELEQVRSEHSQLLEKLQAGHREEKAQLQQQLEAEQRGQKSLQEELATLQAESKKKLKQYRRKAQELQHAVERVKTEHETTKMEKEHLSKSLGLENQKVKRRLQTLQQRHERLLAMMNHGPHPHPHPPGVTVTHFAAVRDACGEDLLQQGEAAELSERVDRMKDVYQQLGGALPDPPAGLEALGSTSSLTAGD